MNEFNSLQSITSQLALWWKELLHIERLDADADFFRVGGDWPKLVRLRTRIRRKYHVDLEVAQMYEERTIASLAVLLHSLRAGKGQSAVHPCLVPLQPRGTHAPVFAVHAVDGALLLYDPLAEALGADQPLYAFRSPLLFSAEPRETDIMDLAARYAQEMRNRFPSGPYYLLGASFGGFVAFEMAKLLASQGIEPGFLLLIDPVVPGSSERVEVSERVSSIRDNLREEGIAYLRRKLVRKFEYRCERAVWQRNNLECRLCARLGRKLPFRLRLFHAEEAHRRALYRHTFTPYAGNVVLARALFRDDILGKRDDPALGWGPLVKGELSIHDFPVNHISMLDAPVVNDFAKLIQTLIAEHEAAYQ